VVFYEDHPVLADPNEHYLLLDFSKKCYPNDDNLVSPIDYPQWHEL